MSTGLGPYVGKDAQTTDPTGTGQAIEITLVPWVVFSSRT